MKWHEIGSEPEVLTSPFNAFGMPGRSTVQRQLCFAPEVLHVRPWPDDVLDHMGHDPRSSYVEDYWLGLLGPSTTWLLRRLAAGFEYSPEGFDLDLGETARSLGLGDRSGRHSPFVRSINRTVQFGLAQISGPEELSVRRRMPPLNRAQLARVSPALQARHAAWQEEQLRLPASEQQLRRARQLALSLLELGEGYDATERQLLRWRYPAHIAREAANWAGAQRFTGLLASVDGGDESRGKGVGATPVIGPWADADLDSA
jgi:hypothetical protein